MSLELAKDRPAWSDLRTAYVDTLFGISASLPRRPKHPGLETITVRFRFQGSDLTRFSQPELPLSGGLPPRKILSCLPPPGNVLPFSSFHLACNLHSL